MASRDRDEGDEEMVSKHGRLKDMRRQCGVCGGGKGGQEEVDKHRR